MFYVIILLFGCTALAYLGAPKKHAEVENQRINQGFVIDISSVAFLALLIILVCFCGLRTFMNDTATYLENYEQSIPNNFSEVFNLDWSLGANPLFITYQIVLKSIFSANGQMFIFFSAMITVTSMVIFVRKKSENFGFSVYLFLAFGVYAFAMSAMKQSLATAIGIWAVPFFLNGKKIRAILLLLVAMLIHPYVFVFVALFFLKNNVWDKKAVIIIILTIISSVAFSSIIERIINLTSIIGDNYDLTSFESNGINIFRVLVYLVTPILSYVFRREIRKENNCFLNLCVNFSLISACFMLIAVSGGAVLIGRMANYYGVFTCISLPMVISIGFSETSLKKPITFLAFVFFFVFYLVSYSKYYPSLEYMFADYYAHVPITELFRG